MAHNLATIQGRIAMAYSGESPWHNLGTQIPATTTLPDALHIANLDYGVSTEPLYLKDGREAPRVAVLREDGRILGTAGTGYRPIPNVEAFGIVEDLGLPFESAGALGAGEVAWLLLKNGGEQEITPGDKVKSYLLVSTSHDGTRSLAATLTNVRVVCQNTLNAVKEHATVSIRHTRSATDRMREAKRILEQYYRGIEATTKLYRTMAKTPMTADKLIGYWESVFPTKKVDAVAEMMADIAKAETSDTNRERQEVCAYLMEHGKGAAGPTVWGAYNAVTEYVDHVYPYRADGGERKNGMQSAVFGGGSVIRQKAWGAATSLLN